MILAFIFKILLALLVLSILVFIHELGHFLFAKWNKVTVLEFAVGFGPVIWQKKVGTTNYALRLIPLGGYVRMAGDDYNKYYKEEGEDFNKTEVDPFLIQAVGPIEKEILEDRSRWFFEKGILARSSIVFAGPLFNFILAWVLIFSVYIIFGASKPSNEPRIGEIIPGYPAEDAGIKVGDVIKSIDGKKVVTWEDLVADIKLAKENPVLVELVREENGAKQDLSLTLTPKMESTEMQLVSGEKNPKTRYLIGIQASFDKEQIGLIEAVKASTYQVYYTSWISLKSVWYLVSGAISAKHIGGPITIVQETVKSSERGMERLLMFVSFISISLAVLNLLPIPVLDGGHLLMFLLEAINGGRLNKKFMDYANQLGLFLLLSLMIFAIGNDLFRLVVN